eukprot:scaffold6834_cov113-Skeletonema_dohrnii-CCMP3373.AAC.7
MRQADLIKKEEESGGGEYTHDMFQSDLKELQRAAAEYAECEVQMMRKSELSVSRERQPWLELSNSITYIAYPSLKS